MTFASLCSGVGGFDLGFERAGMTPIWMCEIDSQCQDVLRAHWPNLPIYGDMTALDLDNIARPDILLMSTPCQGFSQAGLRGSLKDDRSNLCLTGVKIANALNPRVIVFENVPGILSQSDNAFGCFLAALVGADSTLLPPAQFKHRWKHGKSGRYFSWPNAGLAAGPKRTAAWRVLDSQYFGLAQRRKRVFVVCDSGTGAAEKILFESQGLRRHHPPSRTLRQTTPAPSGPSPSLCGRSSHLDLAPPISARTKGGGGLGTDFDLDGGLIPVGLPEVAWALQERDSKGSDSSTKDGHLLCFKPSHFTRGKDGAPSDLSPSLSADADRGDQEAVIAFDTTQITSKANRSNPQPGDPSHPLCQGAQAPVIAYRTAGNCGPSEVIPPLKSQSGDSGKGEEPTLSRYQVRRLTPVEAEFLQGFPRGWTNPTGTVKDSPRYKQLGNAVSVPVALWIANRIKNSYS